MRRSAPKGEPEPWSLPETRALVREVTRQSIVLLKNSAGLLPLDRTKLRSIAVVGPLANQVLLDWYSGTPPYAVSPREGLERAANPPGPPPATGSIGVNWVGDMSDAAVALAARQEVAVVCVGSHPEGNAGWEVVNSPSEGKEAVDRKEITLPPGQEDFVRRVQAANPRTVVVLVTSFPVALPWAAAQRQRRSCTSPTTARSSATRSPTCCSATRTRPAAPPRPGRARSTSCRRCWTTTSAAAAPTCTSPASRSTRSVTG